MYEDYQPMLAVQYIDAIAKTDPTRLLCMVPKGKDPRDGFHNITFQHFAQAVDHLSWHLKSQLGQQNSFNVFGFISHNADFRYQLLIFAASKIGWATFFTSPRNSMVAHISLLDQASCNTWLVDERAPPLVSMMAAQRPLKLVSIPSEEFYVTMDVKNQYQQYPYEKSFEEGRHDVCAVLHSSGSTGIPKVIRIHQSAFCVANAMKAVRNPNFQYERFRGLKMFISTPWFHGAACYITLGAGLFYGVVPVLAPAGPMTAELVDLYHQFADVDMSLVAPSILQDIAGNSSWAEHCQRLKYIANVGGPSTTEVGNILANYTHPVNLGGATEAGLWVSELLDPEDFMYWKFDPVGGAEFRALDQDHFELWLIRDPAKRDYQPVFDTFPELQEWSTKDIYVKHPTKADLWKLVGRTDDVIVLSTGEKVNSVSIESDLCQHPYITGAVAFGKGRFEIGVVLEVLPEHVNNVKDTIEPLLIQINSSTVAHGRLSKDMIIMSSPDKPFPRAGKGTVQKKSCIELYQKEIDDLYNRQSAVDTNSTRPSIGKGFDQTIEYLKKWITTETGLSSLSNDQDIFEAGIGMDSLLVVKLSRELNNAQGNVKVLPQNIYANPTPSKLATLIAGSSASNDFHTLTREQQMDKMLKEVSGYLPLNARSSVRTDNQPLTVAVTGTTGSLGSYLLHSLLSCRPRIGKIYCLNRRSEEEMVKSGKIARGGFQDVQFVQINVSQPRLGLSRELYLELACNIDMFIHNAWDVNFNKSLDSFRVQVHGVRQIIDLCAFSTKGASLHLMSTVGTVENWKPNTDSEMSGVQTAADNHQTSSKPNVPETLHEDWTASMGMGYAESKHISEHLVARACEESGISAAIYRIGQIAGSIGAAEAEMWHEVEWVPTLIHTSVTLGVLPSDLGSMTNIDWIPVNVLSDVIVELVLNQIPEKGSAQSATSSSKLKVFHTINPKVTTWSALLPAISQAIGAKHPIRQVPLQEWVEIVKQAGVGENVDMEGLPALKMISYFENLSHHPISAGVRLETQKTCASSETLSKLEAVKPEWMALWMRQWHFDSRK